MDEGGSKSHPPASSRHLPLGVRRLIFVSERFPLTAVRRQPRNAALANCSRRTPPAPPAPKLRLCSPPLVTIGEALID
ncbi:hypothetical protein AAHA92_18472 [Salvia divinorum]|uniref:Uncharacterized protein n=1 Tax=Salvia divinorum TaxID=28513 RepID=A0ABD1H5F8_SALDI